MTPNVFVNLLKDIQLPGVFNPYFDKCGVHDLSDAPKVRRDNLRSYLIAIERLGCDTIWMGRDLGYRGGRRTGLALTDEQHLSSMAQSYPGSNANRATRGPLVAERTAAEIWGMLSRIKNRPLLWNVFPLHPHEAGDPFSNRKFTARELNVVRDLNHALISWLKIKRIICIGQDAAQYAESFGIQIECIRHPSYGGVRDFRAGVLRLYGEEIQEDISAHSQTSLF